MRKERDTTARPVACAQSVQLAAEPDATRKIGGLVSQKTLREVYPDIPDSYWEHKRWKGDGAPFYKRGRKVLYDLAEVDAWLRSGKCASTSNNGMA
ncbi:MAG: hypothetical protein JST89_00060 [Cyanobacteria bacterium SZAS-4]|nr:hypothetical protein [Cyanobacteria bacterium SZAS-4]